MRPEPRATFPLSPQPASVEDPRRISPAMEIFLVSRNLERIADLATNVAEDVVFLVEGRTIKHQVERRESREDRTPRE